MISVTCGGTLAILFSAPHIFSYVDQAKVIAELKRKAAIEQNMTLFDAF